MTLTASDVENDDQIGLSVAIDGEGADRGAIYIFLCIAVFSLKHRLCFYPVFDHSIELIIADFY